MTKLRWGGMRRFRGILRRRRAGLAQVGAVAAVAFASAWSAAAAVAGPGDIDRSFGTGGWTVSEAVSVARDVLVLPDRKIVVVGGGLCPGRECGFALARFEAGGDPDDAFGSHGGAVTPIGTVGASAVTRQPDGKLVVAGDASGADKWVLARYNEDGTIDSGFGAGGVTVTETAENGAFAADVIVTASGKLVAAGMLDGNFAVLRYNADGSLDETFGNGGRVVTPVGSSASFAHALVELPDGKLLAAGGAMGPGLAGDTSHDALLRYDADGSLDESFGSHGKSIGLAGHANVLVRQPDGKLVSAGSTLARYNADGSPDSAFASGHHTGMAIVNDVVLQPDGKLVLVGVTSSIRESFWIVRRFESDGSADAAFCLPPIPRRGAAYAAALQPDGKLLVTGAGPVFGSGYVLMRYLGDRSGACADLIPPVVRLRIPPQHLEGVLTRGLAVSVGTSERGKATLRLMLTRREASRAGITGETTVGRASHTLARGARTNVRIHTTRAAKKRIGHARKVKFSVRLAVADRSGNTTRLERRLTLRR